MTDVRAESMEYRKGFTAAVNLVLELVKDGCPNCGEVCLTVTECCSYLPRWECETTVVTDVNGDPDAVVCQYGYGCYTMEELWPGTL